MDKLTGKLRYRVGWGKRLVLQVQWGCQTSFGTVYYTYWKDARVGDLNELGAWTVKP